MYLENEVTLLRFKVSDKALLFETAGVVGNARKILVYCSRSVNQQNCMITIKF